MTNMSQDASGWSSNPRVGYPYSPRGNRDRSPNVLHLDESRRSGKDRLRTGREPRSGSATPAVRPGFGTFTVKRQQQLFRDSSRGIGAERNPKLLFVCQFGNNSALIRKIIRNRIGWGPGPGDPLGQWGAGSFADKRVTVNPMEYLPDFQFCWTQHCNRGFLDYMFSYQHGGVVTLNEECRFEVKLKKETALVRSPAIKGDPEDNAVAVEQADGNPASTSASNLTIVDPGDTLNSLANTSTQASTTQGSSEKSRRVLPRVHNHFEGCGIICTKPRLRDLLVRFYLNHSKDPFSSIPITYNVKSSKDPEFALWKQCYEAIVKQNGQTMWVAKPGGWSSQGTGIVIHNNIDDVIKHVDSQEKTVVLQKYIEAPLLIHKRKFDIRAFCLVTQDPGGGDVRAYFYRDPYLRTANREYKTKTTDRMVHITTDAVQKEGEEYGKRVPSNRMSLAEFQQYLDEFTGTPNAVNVQETVVPQMKGLIADTVRAAATSLNQRNIDHCFEIYGFDFMVDEAYRVWLLEVNANPSLELCCPLLSKLVPKMLDEALVLTLDKIFPQAAGKQPSSQRGDQRSSSVTRDTLRGTSQQGNRLAHTGGSVPPNRELVASQMGSSRHAQTGGSVPPHRELIAAAQGTRSIQAGSSLPPRSHNATAPKRIFDHDGSGVVNDDGADGTDWICVFSGPPIDEESFLQRCKWTWTERGIKWLKSEGNYEHCNQPKAYELVSKSHRKFVIGRGDWKKCIENSYIDGESQQYKFTEDGVAFFKRANMYDALGNREEGQVITPEARKYLAERGEWENAVTYRYVKLAVDPVNFPIAEGLPSGAEDERGAINMVNLGRKYLSPGSDARMARTEDIPMRIAKYFRKVAFVGDKRLEHEATNEKRRLREEHQTRWESRKQTVKKNFIRSPQCWNVYGRGHNGKLAFDGGCDGINETCGRCFEYNVDTLTVCQNAI